MSNTVLKWLIVTAIGLFVVSLLLFWFGSPSFNESQVTLKIEGPTQASVGDEVVYKVTYANTTKITLQHIHLIFTYPDSSVILQNGQVVNNSTGHETVDEDTLNPGQSQQKEFHAFLIGDKGNIKMAKASLAFDAGNLKSPFQKTADISTTITNLPVSLTMVAPPNAVNGQNISYILDYRNQSNNDISDLQLAFTYPDGFDPRKFSPAPSQGQATWSLKTIKKGEGGRIQIDGVLNGNQGDSKQVTATLKRNINGAYIDYEKAAATTIIASPLLHVSLNVNDSSNYISHAGDTLQYTVDYQNDSNVTLSGLTLSVRLDGAMYDFSSMDTRGAFFDSSSRTITWNSTIIPAFDNLRPNQNGSAVFSVKLKPGAANAGSGNLFVHATAQLMTENIPDTIDAQQINAQNDLVTKITSQPIVDQSLYYSDPAFGASGPLPPAVAQETVFTVHWRITNPGNTLSGAKVTATLPQGVTWKNVSSVGAGQPEPTFNKGTSQVIWALGTIPQGVGISSPKYELAFQVSIKPSSTQSGTAPFLIKSPALSGVDSFTQQNIVVPGQDLSTNDTIDQSGQGTVQ